MATQAGRYVKVSTTMETTYGNSSAMMAVASFKPIRVKSVSYPVDRGLLIEENIDSYIPTAAYGGALKVSGSIEGYLRHKQMETLFYALMGASAALSASDPVTAGYKYTMGFPLSMQMKVGESTTAATTDLEIGYIGVGIKSCSLTFNPKEISTAKFDWFAKQYMVGATVYSPPGTADYSTEDPVVFYNATVSLDDVPSAYTTVKSITVTIDRKTDEDRYIIGDYTIQEIGINGMTEVSGDITFTEKEYAQFHNALFGATTSRALDTGNTVGQQGLIVYCTSIGSTEVRKMYLKFGNIVFGTTDTTITGNNEIEKKISFKAVGTTFEIGIAT